MHPIDWTIMLLTLLVIVGYGVYKTRKVNSMQGYLLGDKDLPWWTIGLSIMATQASAITFLSTPGKAYEDGLGFAQFYFGMPIAMVILCVFVLPIYYRLNVYTAYEYLEGRFNLTARVLTAFLFLVQRGLAAGITIFAPAIILSNILGWNLNTTILCIGGLVISYTVSGGTKAVSVTQKQQMIVILAGMFIAAVITVFKLPPDVQLSDALSVAGKMGKLEVIDLNFDLNDRYNIWSALFGGVFLFLSYFGTDQSQVQRYLAGKSLTESRLGLLFNGIIKVPMQFLVLFVGILVFLFFLFVRPPLHFNNANVDIVQNSALRAEYEALEAEHTAVFDEQQVVVRELMQALETDAPTADATRERLDALHDADKAIRQRADALIVRAGDAAGLTLETKDEDYIFISFVTNYLPIGLVGLLIAVIFSAAMSSTASELNALATTTVVDFYRRVIHPGATDAHYVAASKLFTVGWGIVAIGFAMFASLFDNLIEAVNIVGSVFYGTILGIFVVAFFLKKVGGRAVVTAGILAEAIVITVFVLDQNGIIDFPYLWLNLIGCVLVVIFAFVLHPLMGGADGTGIAQERLRD